MPMDSLIWLIGSFVYTSSDAAFFLLLFVR